METHKIARLLGYGGALPFIGFGVLVVTDSAAWDTEVDIVLLCYGAVILSFLGGLHWGRVASSNRQKSSGDSVILLWSITPPLVAWIAVLLPQATGAVVMIGCFGLAYFIDMAVCQSGEWHSWMKGMRLHLTLVACASLATVFL